MFKVFLGSLLIGLEGRYKCRSQSYPRDLFLTNIYLTFYNCPALCDLWPLPSSCGCLNGFQLHNNHTTSNIAVLYLLYIQKLTNTRQSILLTSPAASSTGEFCQHYWYIWQPRSQIKMYNVYLRRTSSLCQRLYRNQPQPLWDLWSWCLLLTKSWAFLDPTGAQEKLISDRPFFRFKFV